MAVYIINAIIAALITGGTYLYLDEYGIETQFSKRNKRIRLFVLLCIWIGLFAFKGLTGSDSGQYRHGYKMILDSNLQLDYLLENYRDKLYQVLAYTVSRVSGGSWVALCAAVGAIIYFPILKIIEKNSVDVQLSVLVFLLSLDGYNGYNGMRQMLATSLSIFAFYFFLKEKKIVRYAITMIIAYGFHASILMVLPFHVLSIRKLKSISTKILILLFLLSSLALDSIWGTVITLFDSNVLIAKYADSLTSTYGSGIMRVLVFFSPVVLSLFYYNEAKEYYDDIDSDIMMSFFAAMFMVYSMFSVNFSQMAIYFSISNTILLPKLLNSVGERNYKLLRNTVIILYFIYMVMLLENGDMGLNPYTPVWRNGVY